VRVPALRRTDPVLSSYSQEAVGGAALSDLAHGPALEPLLAEAGRVHAEVHTLAAEGLPAGDDPADLARGLAEPVGWVAACAPAHADDLRRHLRTLVRLAPVPTAPVTCHGDLVPSHLIGGPGDWAVIDLDLAHRGDPDRDLALFLAGLPTDVPALAADRAPASRRRAAEEAYLAGYEDRTGRRVDRRRLAWHRAAASLHHVGLSATKDRWSPTGLAEAVARVGQLLEEAA
jgi:aminoglycoside phosphotransferase (APT) family kinase protein